MENWNKWWSKRSPLLINILKTKEPKIGEREEKMLLYWYNRFDFYLVFRYFIDWMKAAIHYFHFVCNAIFKKSPVQCNECSIKIMQLYRLIRRVRWKRLVFWNIYLTTIRKRYVKAPPFHPQRLSTINIINQLQFYMRFELNSAQHTHTHISISI